MSEEKKNKKSKLLTIGSSKSAQTQFKTALRNHIDLTSIADNKANIMLSINTLIITVALPILTDRLVDQKEFVVPTIILAASSLVSMIFATLATRPIKTAGSTSLDQVMQKKSNLFFFGNFHKMDFEKYVEGVTVAVGDNAILDDSIIRDLFFLGKALGAKYDRLRICYNVFMFGVILAVAAYAVGVVIIK